METKRFDEEGWLEVASPVQVMVALAPPTRAPRVEAPPKGPLKARVVVATLAKVFAPLKYGRFPITAGVEVERPTKERALAERASGKETVRGDS